jgi:hypothetical protein
MSREVMHSSATDEHYTTGEWADRVRATLGGIDLDPASCEEANRVVKAARFFTREDNGLAQDWAGRVYLNAPGGLIRRRSSPVLWWFRLVEDYLVGRVESAMFACFSLEQLQRTQQAPEAKRLPVPLDFPVCYPRARVPYLSERGGDLVLGEDPTHASAFVLLAPLRGRERGRVLRRFVKEWKSAGRLCAPLVL